MKVAAAGRAAAVSLLSGWASNIFHGVFIAAAVGSLSVSTMCETAAEVFSAKTKSLLTV